MDQERQNLRSTKTTKLSDNAMKEVMDDAFPVQVQEKCYHCYALIVPADKGITYSDQTGRFPYQSSRGNKYLFVLYDYDANAILFELLKNRSSESLVAAWRSAHHRLTKNGHKVQLYILDNEISENFVEALEEEKIQF